MKRWIPIIAAFMVGAAVASIAWGWYVVNFQIKLAAVNTTLLHNQANMGERILKYLDDPQAEQARGLSFGASNWIRGYSVSLDAWDKLYPWLGVGRRYAIWNESERKHFEEFMRERQSRPPSIGEPDGAANRSQPVRPEISQDEQRVREAATKYRDAYVDGFSAFGSEDVVTNLTRGTIQSVKASSNGWDVVFATKIGDKLEYYLHVYVEPSGKLDKIVRDK